MKTRAIIQVVYYIYIVSFLGLATTPLVSCSYRGPLGRVSIGQNVAWERGEDTRYYENGAVKSRYAYEVRQQDEEAAFEHLNRTLNSLGLASFYTGLMKAQSHDGVRKAREAGVTARAADGNATKVLLEKEKTTQLQDTLKAEASSGPSVPVAP